MTGYTSAPPPGAGGPRPEFATTQRGLAGWWRRVGAALIDGLLVAGAATALLAGIAAGISAGLDEGAGWYAGAIVVGLAWAACAGVAALLYAPLLMARTNGKTLGRMALGIRVVRANGAPMSFGWALLREVVVKWMLFYAIGGALTLGIAPLVDVLWPLWDEQKRTLHDLLAGTRVLRDRD